METKYILKTQKLYGITVVDQKGGVLDSISFLDKSKKEVSDFVELCNSEKLDPIHLKDAIDDILYK